MPNSRLGLVREGIELCNRKNIGFILAVRGGSVIDFAKGIAAGVANPDQDVWDYFIGKADPASCLPVTLKELGIPVDRFDEIAAKTFQERGSGVGNYVKLTGKDVKAILEIAME